MSMLEKMARRLAQDALERVKPGTYTSVVDGVGLYQMLDGNYQVAEHLGAGDDEEPGMGYDAARETMVAMMATQAGALVVVPEEAPGDPYLAQIAQLLVDSADVPTDASDVADGVAIVGTVKRALDMLYDARGDVDGKSRDLTTTVGHLRKIAGMLVVSPDIAITDDDLQLHADIVQGVDKTLRYLGDLRRQCAANAKEIERYSAKISELRDKCDGMWMQVQAVNLELGQRDAELSGAKRNAKRWEDEAANNQARYEGMEAALRIVLELAGVGK